MDNPTSEPGWVIIARLVRTQGRHGEILADILTDFPELFAERKRLFLLASETAATPVREATLEQYWLHKGRIVLKFSGIDSINDAEPLRGMAVAIPASERAPLTDGAVYISDLLGCEVIDLASSAVVIGRITDVDPGGGLLTVRPERGGDVLIPFVKAYLVKIDLPGKRLEMRLPIGLLDINAPLTPEEREAMERAREN